MYHSIYPLSTIFYKKQVIFQIDAILSYFIQDKKIPEVIFFRYIPVSVGYEKDGFAFLIDGFELSEIIVVIRKANHHPQF